jgi:hypothetical protein
MTEGEVASETLWFLITGTDDGHVQNIDHTHYVKPVLNGPL